MNLIFIALGTFLLCMCLVNAIGYLRQPYFNRWTRGRIEALDVAGEEEIWNVHWSAPENLKSHNPAGEQVFYFKLAHGQTFSSVEERRVYLKNQCLKHQGSPFYVALEVDKAGVIRRVGRYMGYRDRLISYALALLSLSGFFAWLKF